jgi:hypothetical protein
MGKDKSVRGRRWTPEDRQYIGELYATTPTSELAKLLDRSEHAVEHQASLMGILKSEEEVLRIRSLSQQKAYHCEPYSTFRTMYLEEQLSIGVIAEQMGCSISKVQKSLQREGITRTNLDSKRLLSQQKQHNSNFFDSIDTEEKAYWLGFFYADGYLDKNGSLLKIDLTAKDALHLQRFADIFQREVRVHARSADKRNGKIYTTATCVVSCAYLWNELRAKGIKQGNTLSEDDSIFEHMSVELLHHFVRGFFDGDGTVYPNKEGLVFGFVGSFSFIGRLREVLVALAGLTVIKIGRNGKLSYIRWNGNILSSRFKDWLYHDATVWLERKRNVFDAYLT